MQRSAWRRCAVTTGHSSWCGRGSTPTTSSWMSAGDGAAPGRRPLVRRAGAGGGGHHRRRADLRQLVERALRGAALVGAEQPAGVGLLAVALDDVLAVAEVGALGVDALAVLGLDLGAVGGAVAAAHAAEYLEIEARHGQRPSSLPQISSCSLVGFDG